MVKGLRLHVLGSEFERDPPPDPAFPPGVTVYARQIASRAVHLLVTRDRLLGNVELDSGLGHDSYPFRFAPGEYYMWFELNQGVVRTPRPANVHDGELLSATNLSDVALPESEK